MLFFSVAAPAQNVGIGVPIPAAKLDIAGNIKISDGTQGLGKILSCDNNGLASWAYANNSLLQYNYVQASGSGIETSSTLYIKVGTFVYRGSLIDGPFSQFIALMYGSNAGTSYRVRLFDITNNTVIAVSNSSNTGTLSVPDIVSVTSFSNIPANMAIFEIQIQRSSGTGIAGLLSFQLFK